MKPHTHPILPAPRTEKARQALWTALQAEQLVPRLIERLSLGRGLARPNDPAMLRDWVHCLSQDPGWPLIEPLLSTSRPPDNAAWQSAWHHACAAGWAARTDHHNALIFQRLSAELAAASDFEVARYCWQEAIDAWLRVFATDYVADWLTTMGAPGADIRRDLLTPLVELRTGELRRALELGSNAPHQSITPAPDAHPTGIDRRLARFAHDALDALKSSIDKAQSDDPTLTATRKTIDERRADVQVALMQRFEQKLDAVDWSAARDAEIFTPFYWVNEVFGILPIGPASAARVVDAAVDAGWKLRKLKPDNLQSLMWTLLKTTRRFNDALDASIQAGQAFGHNAACADFWVFVGEHHKKDAARAQYFERALAACPGHRNASMMLSYEKLKALSDLLLHMRMLPRTATMLPAAAARAAENLDRARDLLQQAEALFPHNDAIAEYHQKIAREASRLGARV